MMRNIQYINTLMIYFKKQHVNKMLKTAKKMFTTTSFAFGRGGALYSKFEAPNKTVEF